MGCPNTFEFRRQELADLTGQGSIDDETVFQSFLDSIATGGIYREYLQHAQLGVVINDTVRLTSTSLGLCANGPSRVVAILGVRDGIEKGDI